jgi:hypothetical protein
MSQQDQTPGEPEPREEAPDSPEFRADTITKIRQGLEDVKAGRTTPAAEVFEELRCKFSIPRNA